MKFAEWLFGGRKLRIWGSEIPCILNLPMNVKIQVISRGSKSSVRKGVGSLSLVQAFITSWMALNTLYKMCTLPLEKLANFTLNYQKFAAAQMQMLNMTGQMIKIAIIRCNLRVLHENFTMYCFREVSVFNYLGWLLFPYVFISSQCKYHDPILRIFPRLAKAQAQASSD